VILSRAACKSNPRAVEFVPGDVQAAHPEIVRAAVAEVSSGAVAAAA